LQSHEDFYRTAELRTGRDRALIGSFQQARELDLVISYNTYDNADRKENFLVREKDDNSYTTHTTCSDWQLSVLHTTRLQGSREDFYRTAEFHTYNRHNRLQTLI